MENLPQVNAHTSLQSRPDNSKLRRVLDDRLMLSEATKLAGDLLNQFPNTKASDGFIGALASILGQYPKQCAIACANPLRGISRDVEFLSITAVVGWLEKQTEPLRRDVEWEIRVARQIAEREEWQAKTPSERLKILGQSWLDRTDPIAAELVARDAANREARRDAAKSQIERANELLRGRK
jgi:hypothetical protein